MIIWVRTICEIVSLGRGSYFNGWSKIIIVKYNNYFE
jgi:hypothetical protein